MATNAAGKTQAGQNKALTIEEVKDQAKRQVEYYFSDENLRTDAFLHELVAKSEGGWVSIKDLLTFPKLRRIVQKICKKSGVSSDTETMSAQLIDSIASSAIIQVGSEGVRRSPSMPPPPKAPPKSTDKLMHLILDSGAIINGVGSSLTTKAEHFWTVPEVIGEIRDKRARHVLESLPFELRTKEPSQEAMSFIVRFSRQTGDFATLSTVDLKVLALTYMMEIQESGKSHLRDTPINAKPLSERVQAKQQSARPQQTNTAMQQRMGDAQEEAQEPMNDLSTKIDETLKISDEIEANAPAPSSEDGTAERPTSSTNAEELRKEETDDESDDDESSIEDLDAADDAVEEPESNVTNDKANEAVTEANDSEDSDSDDSEEDEDSEEDDDSEDEVPFFRREVHFDNPQDSQPQDYHYAEEDFPALGGDAATAPAPAWPKVSSAYKRQPKVEERTVNIAPSDPVGGELSSHQPTHTAATCPRPTLSEQMASDQASESKGDDKVKSKEIKSRILGVSASGMTSVSAEAMEDDGKGWVNPDNLVRNRGTGMRSAGSKKAKQAQVTQNSGKKPQNHRRKKRPVSLSRAACVTTDYAMQNVMLQVGLRLLSVDGYVVKRVNSYVLRCNACFRVMFDTERIFCDRCGHNYVSRVAAGVDENTGELKLYLKRDYQHKLQGTKFSLPKPGSNHRGRFDGDYLLREDQLMMGIWKQKTAPKAKDKTSMFGVEVNEKTGVNVRESAHPVVIGFGRKNPNALKGRERRGKKKRSKK